MLAIAQRARYAVAVMMLAYPLLSPASVVLTAQEFGADVIIAGTGDLNIGNLTLISSGGSNPFSGTGAAVPLASNIGVGLSPLVDKYTFPSLSFPVGGYGTGATAVADIAGPLEPFGFVGVTPLLLSVPVGYMSGAPLGGFSTFTGATLASLGFDVGTYVWNWGNDVIVLNVVAPPPPQPAVPEPGTLPIMALGLAGIGFSRRRKLH